MDIGVGLPGHVRDLDGRTLIEWATRTEAAGFSALSVSDRLNWSSPEPLVTLAAAAGATQRIKLISTILVAPLRANHALLAKSAATVDRLAGPRRLHLGLAPGGREEDFTLSKLDFRQRGRQLDELLADLHTFWQPDSEVGPSPATPGGPALLFGGMSEATLRRITTYGGGWVIGDCTVEEFQGFVPKVQQAWAAGGHTGSPKLVASLMFALGPDARQAAADAIGPYYAFIGDEWAQYSIDAALTTRDDIVTAVEQFEKAGCDQLLFMGNSADPDQVDLLAEAVRGAAGARREATATI
ncbi:LLM class flavin-dependent oxidoreductase [Frankia sp. AiPs1]|uniref:LLM class flavin-dependent oxidoreductase n=1 Tax=Frankia sp. AiPs1 TaxID=573493 RepID=UPI002044C313|nr:LLM class flavin-dependent oxidoreductase [Frankia sp. AiPs1]MCM3920971.1 LLM class flavin-dependent oxidoreductase [Frankia sp. AiPs1]